MDMLNLLNNNKFMVGTAMVMMNFGSRYLMADMTAKQDALFKNIVFRKVALFCIFFVGTRDILVAAMLWFATTFVMDFLLNEHRKYSVLSMNIDPVQIHKKYIDTHEKLSI
jgi:hypothetical protein